MTQDEAISQYLKFRDIIIEYHEENKQFTGIYFDAVDQSNLLYLEYKLSTKIIDDYKKRGHQRFNSFKDAMGALSKI